MKPRQVWFRGGSIEVLTGDEGRILAVGPALRSVAGYECQIVELRGEVLPGLHDAHLHLGYLVEARRQVDLHGVQSIDETVDRLSKHASNLSQTAWVVGRGWDLTKSARFTKAELRRLEVAVGGRPLALKGEDGHSCWGSRAALTAAGISEQTSDVAGGIIERDQAGNVTGILREGACALLTRMRPKLSGQEFEAGLAEVLGELARFGLTTVHSMDGIEEWEALQRLRRQGRLPLRVVSYFRYPELELAAEVRRLVGSDPWLRVGGIKAFLDGTLSSRTAAMVGGGGMLIYQPAELARVARECAQQNFNVGWHAIGDRAVRLALDVLEPMVNTFPGWRPRIEHAQCVRPEDQLRFRAVGAVASMQPAHALSDREVAEREWSIVLSWAYPWNALGKAGVVLAFGSDAPFGDPDPLHGLAAATGWRQEVGWYPELALTRQAALRAYTFGAAYAAGIESEVGRLEVGQRCDLTVIQDGQITATVVEGELVSGRKTTAEASPRAAPAPHRSLPTPDTHRGRKA